MVLADMIKALVDPLVVFADDQLTIDQRFKETFRQIKVLISPMTPSNYDVELASERLLTERGFKTPRNCVRNQRPTNRIPNRRGAQMPRKSRVEGPNAEVSSATKKRRNRRRGPKKPVGTGTQIPVQASADPKSSAEAHDL